MRGAWNRPGLALAGLLCVAAARGQGDAAGDRIDRALPLCNSPDPAARRFCVEEILAAGDPTGRARDRLREMAASDVEVGAIAADALRALYGEEPPAPASPAQPEPSDPDLEELAEGWPDDPGVTRGIFFPTAFTRPRGETAWTIFDLGHWTFDHGATDSVEVGVQTGPPAGALLVAPQIKASLHAESASVGLFAFGGAFLPVVGDLETVLFYGGGPIVTLGSPDRFVNFGMQTYFLSADGEGIALLLPNVGASARVARRVRVGFEMWVPDVAGENSADLDPGDLILVNYGVRIVGSRLWADLAFVYPICDDCGEITQVLPLGFPLLGAGLTW